MKGSLLWAPMGGLENLESFFHAGGVGLIASPQTPQGRKEIKAHQGQVNAQHHTRSISCLLQALYYNSQCLNLLQKLLELLDGDNRGSCIYTTFKFGDCSQERKVLQEPLEEQQMALIGTFYTSYLNNKNVKLKTSNMDHKPFLLCQSIVTKELSWLRPLSWS